MSGNRKSFPLSLLLGAAHNGKLEETLLGRFHNFAFFSTCKFTIMLKIDIAKDFTHSLENNNLLSKKTKLDEKWLKR